MILFGSWYFTIKYFFNGIVNYLLKNVDMFNFFFDLLYLKVYNN